MNLLSLDLLSPIFTAIFVFVMMFLPVSPFQAAIQATQDIPFLSNLNWFFPVTEAVAILQMWVAAIGVYYLYHALLRMIHVIGG